MIGILAIAQVTNNTDPTGGVRHAAQEAGLEVMFKPIDADALGAFVLQSD